MSRAKLFNMLQSRGLSEVGRNSFDLSNRHIYPSKAAKIIPVKAIHTVPKDFFRITMDEFTQNNIPMNTAAFLSGIKELSAYYVPYNTIWHNFNQYMATREDPDSSLLQQQGISFEPRIGKITLYSAAFVLFVLRWKHEQQLKAYGIANYINTIASIKPASGLVSDTFITKAISDGVTTLDGFLDYAKRYRELVPEPTENDYVIPESSVQSTVDSWANSPFVNLAQTIEFASYSCLHLTCWETIEEEDAPTNLEFATDKFGIFRWCDWVQKLDMLGYGNLYPVLHQLDVKLSSIFEEFMSTPLSDYALLNTTIYNDFNQRSHVEINNVDINLLNYCSYLDSNNERHFDYVNCYSLYAYNKVFYDMFRNTYYDLNYNVRNFNIDFLDCNTLQGSIINSEMIPYRFYNIETHQWRKDMFTGVLPDNQLGDVSSLVLGGSDSLHVDSTIDFDNTSINTTYWDTEVPSHFYAVGEQYNHGVSKVLRRQNSDGLIFSETEGQTAASGIDQRIENSHRHAFSASVPFSVDIPSSSNISLNVLALKRAEAIQQYRQDLMRA